MDSIVLVAIITGVFSLAGAFLGVLASAKLTNYRIQQLEQKVDKHNNVIERVYDLEGKVDKIQTEINIYHHS